MAASGGFCRIGTAAAASAPTNGTTAPHYTLSERTNWGSFTQGFLWAPHLPTAPAGTAATIGGGGLSVTVWVRNPVTKRWANYAEITGVDEREAVVTFDSGPTDLYFQIASGSISANGDIDIDIMEM